MKKRAWIAGILITLLCVGFGLAFPFAVFSETKEEAVGRVEEYAVEPKVMGSVNSIFDAMRCLYMDAYTFDYQEDMANLTKEQVKEICNSFLKGLQIECDVDNMKMVCQLIVANMDESYNKSMIDNKAASEGVAVEEYEDVVETAKPDTISAVIWSVSLEIEPDRNIELCVDDKNQKVVQMLSFCTDKNLDYYYDNEADNYYLEDVVLPFLKDYYNLDMGVVEVGKDYYNVIMTDENQDQIVVSLYCYMEMLSMSFIG